MSTGRIAWDFDTVLWPAGQAGRALLHRGGARMGEVRYTGLGVSQGGCTLLEREAAAEEEGRKTQRRGDVEREERRVVQRRVVRRGKA